MENLINDENLKKLGFTPEKDQYYLQGRFGRLYFSRVDDLGDYLHLTNVDGTDFYKFIFEGIQLKTIHELIFILLRASKIITMIGLDMPAQLLLKNFSLSAKVHELDLNVYP